MILFNATKKIEICRDLRVADTFYKRFIGLMGREALPTHEAHWFKNCTSIHTHFMKFAIDVIFVDADMVVRATFKDLKPWKLILPVWRTRSVFECAVGTIDRGQIEKGDLLSVLH